MVNYDKSILVTGGTGFLGSYLLRYLVEMGFTQIYAIKRKSSSMDLVATVKNKINWLEGDILDLPFLEEVLEGKQQIYHCAAMVSFQSKDKQQMMEINDQGTANIVNVALANNIEKLVHTSSIAALGRNEKADTIDEKAVWEYNNFNSNYAKSKYKAEMHVWRGIAEGLTAAMVNPSLIMGSGFWNAGTPKMFQTLSRNFPFYPKGGTGVVDVRDVARFMIALMNSDIVSERFVLNGENISYQELFGQIAIATDAKPPHTLIPEWLSQIIWRLEWIRSKLTGANPLYTKENAATTKHVFKYKNDKSKSVFDFEYTPIEKTLNDAGKQFLASKDKKSAYLLLNHL